MAYIKLIAHIYVAVCWGGFCIQHQQQKFFSGQKLLQKDLGQAREKIKIPKDMRPETMRGSLKVRKHQGHTAERSLMSFLGWRIWNVPQNMTDCS